MHKITSQLDGRDGHEGIISKLNQISKKYKVGHQIKVGGALVEKDYQNHKIDRQSLHFKTGIAACFTLESKGASYI